MGRGAVAAAGRHEDEREDRVDVEPHCRAHPFASILRTRNPRTDENGQCQGRQ